MAKFYKVALLVFVVLMSIQVSISMYDIYRGDTDMFSRHIVGHVPGRCGSKDYCSCGISKTFKYVTLTRNGKCVKNDDFRTKSGCSLFSYFSTLTSIQIVRQQGSTAPLLFHFWAGGICTWSSTEYTVQGDNWQPAQSNVGSILVFSGLPRRKTLQINNPNALISTFPGMLLKIQIECYQDPFFASERTDNCLVLKIEGKTNLTSPVLPTSTPSEITTFPDLSAASTTATTSPPILSLTSSHTASFSHTNQITETTVKSQEKDLNTNASPITKRLPISTTSIPSDPENGERGDDENDSRNLVPILVPILLLFVLLIVLCGVFLYRKRQRSMSRNIDKEFADDNTLPRHATMTKEPQGSAPFYAVPGSQINTVPIYDTVCESTGPPRESAPNYYEFEDDDYATCDDIIPPNPEVNQNPADRTSPPPSYTNPTAEIYQDTYLNKGPGSTVSSKDNLGYIDQSTEDPYYFSLEDASNENIYDRVTEEPQEHVYNVLEN